MQARTGDGVVSPSGYAIFPKIKDETMFDDTNFRILSSENGKCTVEIQPYKDKVSVKAHWGNYSFEKTVLPSDIKYLPGNIHAAEEWTYFYEKVVSQVGLAEYDRALKHVANVVIKKEREAYLKRQKGG